MSARSVAVILIIAVLAMAFTFCVFSQERPAANADPVRRTATVAPVDPDGPAEMQATRESDPSSIPTREAAKPAAAEGDGAE